MATKKNNSKQLEQSAAAVQTKWEDLNGALADYQEALGMLGQDQISDFPPRPSINSCLMLHDGIAPRFHPIILAEQASDSCDSTAFHQHYFTVHGPVPSPGFLNIPVSDVIPGGLMSYSFIPVPIGTKPFPGSFGPHPIMSTVRITGGSPFPMQQYAAKKAKKAVMKTKKAVKKKSKKK